MFVPTFRRDILPASSGCLNLVEGDGEIMGRLGYVLTLREGLRDL
jgi:hypothetical protein